MTRLLRVPLESYLTMNGAKVYSLVAEVPFSPLDIDLGRLARGEWNALTDRFRFWCMPREGKDEGPPVCYLMIRKFDAREGVLVYGHVVVDNQKGGEVDHGKAFSMGILSNDEVRARSMLSSTLDIPPAFHRRSEVRLVERRWRSDPEATMRFLANVHSAIARQNPSAGDKAYTLRFEPPPGMMGELRRNMGAWW